MLVSTLISFVMRTQSSSVSSEVEPPAPHVMSQKSGSGAGGQTRAREPDDDVGPRSDARQRPRRWWWGRKREESEREKGERESEERAAYVCAHVCDF